MSTCCRSATAVARDSGVDSVLSLPHQGYALDDSDTVPGLDDLGLADIQIPAAGDDDLEGKMDDDMEEEKLSLGYSHYEDIEVLDSRPAARLAAPPPADDVYLDPRRPDPSGRTSASLRRNPTNRSDRYGYAIAIAIELHVNKDLTFKAKDKEKDKTLKAKDQDKD